ncbi:MAG: hypothetical protein CMJ43_18640 [Phyllobacteriaceae bacterium]|nr:hypothetical protein [Phyllobacteriaceae bacterium]
MKLFGEYLVEKKIITEEQLTSALVEQIKNQPSVVEIIHDEKLLKPNEILSILGYQTKNKLSFITAAKTLNLWSEEIGKRVEKVTFSKRIPIGQMLLKQGSAEFQTMIDALDDFLSESGSQKKAPESSSIAPDQSNEPQKTAPKLAGEFDDEDLKNPPEEMIETFAENISEDHYSKCISQIETLENEAHHDAIKNDPETFTQPIHFFLHTYRGSARFLELEKVESLAARSEELLELVKSKLGEIKPSVLSKSSESLEKAVKKLWAVKEMLTKLGSHDALWKDEDFLREFDLVHDEIEIAKFDVEVG